MFQVLKQNFGGHKLNDDRKVEKIVTRWLITKERDVFQQSIEIPSITNISLIRNKLFSGCPGHVEFCTSRKWVKIRSNINIEKGVHLKSKLLHTATRPAVA